MRHYGKEAMIYREGKQIDLREVYSGSVNFENNQSLEPFPKRANIPCGHLLGDMIPTSCGEIVGGKEQNERLNDFHTYVDRQEWQIFIAHITGIISTAMVHSRCNERTDCKRVIIF
jgi:hypothetical protein